jgi:diguanylate cyclase (GGDEF)-like protein/PAS domain S-box-containing protein
MHIQAEANLSALIESTEDLIWSVDLENRLVTYNSALQRHIESTFGVRLIPGMFPKEIVPPERATLLPPLYERARTEGSIRVEFSLVDGRTMDLALSPILTDGVLSGVCVFGKDITDRKRTEQAQREDLDVLRETQIVGALGSYVHDIAAGAWTSSEVMDEIFGIGKEYVRSVAGWAALIHPEDRAMMTSYFADEVLGKGKTFDKEYRVVRQSDGAERWVHGIGRLDFDAQGKPAKMRGVIKDITERKRAEMQLCDSEERYRNTFEQAAIGIVHTSFEGRMLRCNARFAEIVGYPLVEIPGMTFQQVTEPQDLAPSLATLERLLSGPVDNTHLEKRFVRKDGSLTWAKLTISIQRDSQGRALHFMTFAEDINARKAAEERLDKASEALAASEHRFRTFFEKNGSVMVLVEPSSGEIVHANRAAAKFYGYSREELIGMPVSRINTIPPEEIALERQQALREERGFFNFRHRLASGEEREVGVYSSPVEIEGKLLLFSIVHDLTEQKQAERALAASELRFRTFFEENGSVMFLADPETGEIVAANRAACEFYGYPKERLVGMFTCQINLSSPEDCLRDRQTALRGECSCFYYSHRLAGGDVREVELRSSPFEIDGRQLLYAIVNDITERKRAEVERRNNEEHYRSTFEQAAVGIIHATFEGIILRCNAHFAEMLGYAPEELKGLDVQQITAPGDGPASREALERVLSDGAPASVEKRYLRKDGNPTWARLTISFQRDGEGRPLYFTGLIEDINARKAAEERLAATAEALRLGEERYRIVFDTCPNAIVVSRLSDGVVIEANRTYLDAAGYSREQAIGRTTMDLGIWANAADRQRLIDSLLRNGECRDMDFRSIRRTGGPFWMRVSASLIEIAGEECIVAFAQDISEAKASEERLAVAANALRLSEERYRTAFQTSLDSININRLDNGVYVDVNRAFVEIMGYDRQEVIGYSSLELDIWANPGDREKLTDSLRRNFVVQNLEAQFRRKNGTLLWGLMSASVIELDGVPCILSITRDITDAKASRDRLAAATDALRLSEERYRSVFQTCPDVVTITRVRDGRILDVNQAFLDSSGFERNEVIGRTNEELGLWVNARERQDFVDAVACGNSVRDLEARSRRKNGEIFWIRLSSSLIEIEGEQCRLTFAKEITEVRAAEERLASATEALLASEERYRTVFHTSLDCITLSHLSDGRYIDVNKAFLDLIGIEPEEIVGRTSTDLGIWADPGARAEVVELLRRNPNVRDFQTEFVKKSGEKIWVLISATVIEIGGISCIVSVVRDISGAKAAESTIHSLALYDPLTGLPNRRMIFEGLGQSLADGHGRERLKALLLVDVDNLKTLNDTLGHHVGDLLLQEVARRIASCAHEADTVGRLGGDEFVVILDDLSEISGEAATQAKAVGQQILSAISQPYLLENRECLTAASMGVTIFGNQEKSADEILQKSDIALHLAKADGRNTLRFFSPSLQAVVNAQAVLESDLRQAIKRKEFMLYYQPQVERGRLTGAEALIRWMHPTRGIVLPDEFIPIAEQSRLILPMGDWVLETACERIASWAARPETAHLTCAVNISALQFRQPEFVERVLTAIKHTGANPKRLKLELTESMLVENIEDVIGKMTELKSHGLSFSLDDFGTGYSSLAYLKRLPLDQLKIDRSFVRDMLVDLTSGAIAQTIVSLSRAMELSVIAEGVETEEQRGFLAGLGCHCFQGYLFSPALPPDELEAFL